VTIANDPEEIEAADPVKAPAPPERLLDQKPAARKKG